MYFGCCIRETNNIRTLKELGFDFFEFAGFVAAQMSEKEFDRICSIAEEESLPCIGFNAYCTGNPAIIGEAFDPGEIYSYAEKICSRGARLGIRSIGIGAPRARLLPPDYPPEKAMSQCRTFLEITSEVAERYSLRVLFESVHAHVCDFANTVPEAIAVLRYTERAGLGLVLDFYHMEVMGEKLDVLNMAAPWLAHVHVSSCGADLNRGFPEEHERDLYEKRFRALKEIGYHGSVSIEPDRFDADAAARSLCMLREASVNIKGEDT